MNMLDYTDLEIQNAVHFARGAHRDQKRKYLNTPYYLHCLEVAELVASVGMSRSVQIAALLHDTVEDTATTIKGIRSLFGGPVAELVDRVTDVSVPLDGNRGVRKAIDRDHLSKASVEAKVLKLADLISNSQSIMTFDEKFAKVYLAEKRELLNVLIIPDGHPGQALWDMANEILEREGF